MLIVSELKCTLLLFKHGKVKLSALSHNLTLLLSHFFLEPNPTTMVLTAKQQYVFMHYFYYFV